MSKKGVVAVFVSVLSVLSRIVCNCMIWNLFKTVKEFVDNVCSSEIDNFKLHQKIKTSIFHYYKRSFFPIYQIIPVSWHIISRHFSNPGIGLNVRL